MNVFISHAGKDRAYAETVGRELTEAGLSVWEPNQLQAGENWKLAVGKALADACHHRSSCCRPSQ